MYRALRDHGYDVVAVHHTASSVAGDPCVAVLADVPDAVDGVMVMVASTASAGVVEECVRLGIDHVWLFKGLGGPGAVSDAAVARCHEHGIAVVAGACPLMFLEPVGWFHRVHRTVRRAKGVLAESTLGS